MIATDRSALICDLAETYHILDMRALPASLLATLSDGLRDDSRIKMRLGDTNATRSELLLASAVDRLSLLAWAQSKDGQAGRGQPKSILDILLGADKPSSVGFDSATDYEAAWAKITGVTHG